MSHPELIDLDYEDTEPVMLDLSAIVRRGARLRRKRLIVRVTAVVVAAGLVPGLVTVDISRQISGSQSNVAVNGLGARHAVPGQGKPSTATGGGYSAAAGTAPTASSTAVSRPAEVRRAVTLPGSYGAVRGLAGDRSGAGAWFWDATARQIAVFHVSAAGHLSAWRVLPATGSLAGLVTGGDTGFAVLRGVAWLGVHQTLIRLDTATREVSTWRVPAARPGTTGRRSQAIEDLAVGPSGEVAMAMSNSSSALVLAPATGRFRPVLMPAEADQPIAVGYASDGALGVGYQHLGVPGFSAVLFVPRGGPAWSATVAQPSKVSPYGQGGLLIGTSTPDIVDANGDVRPLTEPERIFGPSSSGSVRPDQFASDSAGDLWAAGGRTVALLSRPG
jgi:hypothetical protein